jgi:hypothetical protein
VKLDPRTMTSAVERPAWRPGTVACGTQAVALFAWGLLASPTWVAGALACGLGVVLAVFTHCLERSTT